MNDLSSFNTGHFLLGSSHVDKNPTVFVVGVGRSGTSAVAATLARMGLFMGDDLGRVNFEDRKFASAFESGDRSQLVEVVEEYNSRFQTWGVKRPSFFKDLDLLASVSRRPRFVVIYRDLAAIACRREMSSDISPFDSIRGTLGAYRRITEFFASSDLPSMHISYEKFLEFPRDVISALAQFASISTPYDLEGVIAGVISSEPSYREVARPRKT